MMCATKGCPYGTLGNSLFCYYHSKVVAGIITPDTSYLKSQAEIDCVSGKRDPNWALAMSERSRVRRICHSLSKWSRIQIKELVQESLLFIATSNIKKDKHAHYINVSLRGMLKNYIAKFKESVSYYWGTYIKSIDSVQLDEEQVSTKDKDPEETMSYKEQITQLQNQIIEFRKGLTKEQRYIFDRRIYTQETLPIRIIAIKLASSKSTIQRQEQELKQQFKEFING